MESLNFPSFDDVRSFGSERAWTGRPAVLALLVDRLEPKRLLDVGCKSGWLIDHSQAPFKVGIDTDDAPGVCACADACTLPFRSASFDVVTLLDVIEHLPKGMEGVAISEASRVLEPGGYLVVSTPADWHVGKLTDPLWMLYGHRHYQMSPRPDLGRAGGAGPCPRWNQRPLGRRHWAPDRVRLPEASAADSLRPCALPVGMARLRQAGPLHPRCREPQARSRRDAGSSSVAQPGFVSGGGL